VEANEKLGFGADLRNYGVGAQILGDLGIHRLKLLTNNPRKIAGLGGYGLEVVSRVPLVINPGDYNANYLATKRDKLGHLFDENSATNVVTLAWDCGEELSAKLPDLLNRAETLSSKLSLALQPEQTPRLLALWERPQFVWTVSGNASAIELFLKTLASWTETKRLGLLKTAKAEQRLHPSLQLNREERDLASLLNNKKNGWSETSGQPILIHWS
jgi:3,4-dihydroxy 2-butanone 4-phosphate synthase/GTP cyclohydrolase II